LLCAAKGWITKESFFAFIKFFARNVNAGADGRWWLLIVDNHSSRYNEEMWKFAADHKILLLALPSNSTSMLQPVDVGPNGPFKAALHRLIDVENAKPVPPERHDIVGRVLYPAWKSAFTPENVSVGWRNSGLFPLDRTKIRDIDLIPRTVAEAKEQLPQQTKTWAVADDLDEILIVSSEQELKESRDKLEKKSGARPHPRALSTNGERKAAAAYEQKQEAKRAKKAGAAAKRTEREAKREAAAAQKERKQKEKEEKKAEKDRVNAEKAKAKETGKAEKAREREAKKAAKEKEKEQKRAARPKSKAKSKAAEQKSDRDDADRNGNAAMDISNDVGMDAKHSGNAPKSVAVVTPGVTTDWDKFRLVAIQSVIAAREAALADSSASKSASAPKRKRKKSKDSDSDSDSDCEVGLIVVFVVSVLCRWIRAVRRTRKRLSQVV
jgi:hypothetical protein